ncbi:MAG: LysR substrate-binding domain-containing protein [Rickettsiales bacterium]|nr:LysR substrate-binding domain-containing protein [Rickettsiales bacterium]
MNLRDMEYVIAVADTGSFGKAALRCHVSQPTLSMQIKKLEDYLGIAIFERNNRRVLVTAIGEDILKKARKMVEASNEMVDIARHSRDPFSGDITLGAFPTLSPYLTPYLMPDFKQHFPKLLVRLVEEKTDDLIARLQEGTLDCALLAAPIDASGLEVRTLFEEPFYLAVSHTHPLASRKKLDIQDLQQHELLLLDEGHCLRAQTLELCQRIGYKESQSFRATSLETLREMVAHGQFATLMPQLALHRERADMCYIPFTQPQPSRVIALCWRKTTGRIRLMEELAVRIKHQAKAALKSH